METPSSTDADDSDGADSLARSPARYLWATLIARLFEIFPLTCPHCGAEMKIIAFVTETPSVRAILAHIGEPTRPPAIALARAPPAWKDAPVELEPGYDPLAQPEPDSQRFSRTRRSRVPPTIPAPTSPSLPLPDTSLRWYRRSHTSCHAVEFAIRPGQHDHPAPSEGAEGDLLRMADGALSEQGIKSPEPS